jgi:hypothetical protein
MQPFFFLAQTAPFSHIFAVSQTAIQIMQQIMLNELFKNGN